MESNMTPEQLEKCYPLHILRMRSPYRDNQAGLAKDLRLRKDVIGKAERGDEWPGDDEFLRIISLLTPTVTVKAAPSISPPTVLKARMIGHTGFVAFTFTNGMPVEDTRFGNALHMSKRKSCGYDTPGKMDSSNITKFRYRLDSGELWRVIQAKDVDLPNYARNFFVWQIGVMVVWREEFGKANVDLQITEEKCKYGSYCQCKVEDFPGHWVDTEDENA